MVSGQLFFAHKNGATLQKFGSSELDKELYFGVPNYDLKGHMHSNLYQKWCYTKVNIFTIKILHGIPFNWIVYTKQYSKIYFD